MDFFGFFVVTEPATSHLVRFATVLGHAFSSKAPSYGSGVKAITVTLLLTSAARDRPHRLKKPKYSPGIREIKAHGLTAKTEDTLEFSVRPFFELVLRASSEGELAQALLPAVKEVEPSVLKLKVPNFDSQRFLADLEAFLLGVAAKGT